MPKFSREFIDRAYVFAAVVAPFLLNPNRSLEVIRKQITIIYHHFIHR